MITFLLAMSDCAYQMPPFYRNILQSLYYSLAFHFILFQCVSYT